MRKRKILPGDNKVNIRFGSTDLKLKPTMKKGSIRMFGVWFNAFNKKDHVIKQIKKEIRNCCQSMILRKNKQMLYIFNTLIIPKVKYHTQLLILSDRHLGPFLRIN